MNSEFNEYFLSKRLKRVPLDLLVIFLRDIKGTDSSKSQAEVVEEIIKHYEIMKTNDLFIEKLHDFIRDYVLSAKESEYILYIQSKTSILRWIDSWPDNLFNGHNFNFSLNTISSLNDKVLTFDNNSIYLPTEVVLMFASSKKPQHIPSGNTKGGFEMMEYYPITEFEIIFRKDSNLMEVRGDYKVIKDFVSSAISDKEESLSMLQSIFIGDNSSTALVKSVRIVKIDELKTLIDGSYKSISAPVKGNKTARVEVSLDDLSSIDEETHPLFKTLLEDHLIDYQDKSDISFKYDKKKYSFSITKFGGIYFRQYASEEVVSYVLANIKNIIEI
jgi:hypothetical protein